MIIRCGYGMDQASQDDREWKRNADACARLGIPFGAYLSLFYADSIEKAASEAQHARSGCWLDTGFPIRYIMI